MNRVVKWLTEKFVRWHDRYTGPSFDDHRQAWVQPQVISKHVRNAAFLFWIKEIRQGIKDKLVYR